jgi:branched-chain amino acid transport system permease protein
MRLRLTGASIRVAGLLVSLPQLVSLVVAIALVTLLTMLVRRSRIGRALRAIAENRDAATVIGIDVARIVPVVFAVTGLLCAIAGAIYAVNYGQVSSTMGDDVGVKAIAGMVIGGLGSIWGAVVGGLAVGLVEALSIQYLGTDSVTAVVWGLLLLMLLVWPQGLFGSNRVGRGKL